jgi:ATP-binding cassette subfamily B protein
MTTGTTLSRFRRLTPFVRPFFRRLVSVFVLSLFGTILGLLWPVFSKILIDDVLLAKNVRLLFMLSGVMVVVTAVSYLLGALNRYYYTQVTARILFALRQHLFAHLQMLPLRFHTRAKVGDLLSRLNTDIAEIQAVLTDAVCAFVTNLFVLLATVGFLLWLNWQLFLVSIVVVPLQLYGVYKVRPLLVAETRKVRELNADIASFLVESLSAIKFIKLFTAENIQLNRLGSLGEQLRDDDRRLGRLFCLPVPGL